MSLGDYFRRAELAKRQFDLEMRQVFAQWDIDTAAAEHRRRMLALVRSKQLKKQPNYRRLAWREPFE